jgi:hypothetical protein
MPQHSIEGRITRIVRMQLENMGLILALPWPAAHGLQVIYDWIPQLHHAHRLLITETLQQIIFLHL